MAKKTIRCPECNNRVAYVKQTTGEGVCHICGVIKKAEIDRQRKEQTNKKEET